MIQGKIEDSLEYQNLLKEVNQLKFCHQMELKDIRNIAKQYTVDFFKEKCTKLQIQFNSENQQIFEEFDKYRSQYFKDQKKILTLYRYLNLQERMIEEQRTMIKTNFEQIYFQVEKNDHQIVQMIADLLPTPVQYSRFDKTNPFNLYCGYLDLVRPIEEKTRLAELMKQIKELEDKLAQRIAEYEMSLQYAIWFQKQEDTYKLQIEELKELLAKEREESAEKIAALEAELKRLREEGRVDLEIMTTEYKNFRQYVAIEIDVSKRIAEQSVTDRNAFIGKIRELKGIIRVPRLYEKYKD